MAEHFLPKDSLFYIKVPFCESKCRSVKLALKFQMSAT